MKTNKVEKVITTLKNRIAHPLKRHLTEISTGVNNLNLANVMLHINYNGALSL